MDRLIRNMDKIIGRRPILPADLARWTESLAQQLVLILSASDCPGFDEDDGSPVTLCHAGKRSSGTCSFDHLVWAHEQ
jgi:hypothetical protein